MAEEKRCQYERLDEKPCPHPYFTTWEDPETGGKKDYCIFHAPMEAKEDKVDKFWEAFEVHFEKTEKEYEAVADEEEIKLVFLDCEGFIFPGTGVRFVNREFLFIVNFDRAVFTAEAYFTESKFKKDVYFSRVEFRSLADFISAIFDGTASFIEAKFSDIVYFNGAKFFYDAGFHYAEFVTEISFSSATFYKNAIFTHSKFHGIADFWNVHIVGETVFTNALLANDANFCQARFTLKADFNAVVFKYNVDYSYATFFTGVEFVNTVFDAGAYYEGAVFGGYSSFKRSHFAGYVDLRDIVSEKGVEFTSYLLLRYVYFSDPNRAYIGGPGVKTCSFVGTNIEGVNFVDAKWPRRKGLLRKYRKKAFDEELAEIGDVSWEEAVEVYRKLRRNFEGRLAYETAGDFHFGQMWCRIWDKNRPVPDHILTWLYWALFSFGESISKPLIWFVVVIAALLITLGPELAIRSLFSFGVPADVCLSQLIISQVGRLAAVIFATFFILALRRRFKR